MPDTRHERAVQAFTSTRRYGRKPEHASLEVQCPACKSVRAFHVWIAPDPDNLGPRRAERMAIDWYATHPCYPPAKFVKAA